MYYIPHMNTNLYTQHIQLIEADLKAILTGLATHLFGDVDMRWREV